MARLTRLRIVSFLGAALAAAIAAAEGRVTIESPAKNAVVTSGDIYVTGTMTSTSRNVGVLVNDVAALVDLAHAGTKSDPFRWFATVPSAGGRVKLKARISESDDERASSVIFVQHVPPAIGMDLRALPHSGLIPLEVEFIMSTHIVDGVRYELDLDGDGQYERTSAEEPESVSTTYGTPGLRRVSVRVTRASGEVVTVTTPVLPQAFNTINTILQDVWRGFGDALARRDVNTATRSFAGDTADKYRGRLELIRENLPRFADGIRKLEAISIVGDVAHYLVTRDEDGTVYGYHVYFVRDANGVWKIAQF